MKHTKPKGWPKLSYSKSNASNTVGIVAKSHVGRLVKIASNEGVSLELIRDAMQMIGAKASDDVEIVPLHGKGKVKTLFAVHARGRVAIVAPRVDAKERLSDCIG